jgi:RHS repeat-associated protein
MDGFSQTLRYDYDELGNRTQVILPDGQTIDTLLYGSGHWHQVAFNGHSLFDVERDSLHREVSRTLGSGSPQMVAHPLTRSQGYTALGQIDTTAWHRGGQLIEQRRHQYSEAGLLTQIDRELDGLRSLTRYAYDPQERLTAWDVHALTAETEQQYRQLHKDSWAHDPAGNPMAPGAKRRIDPVSGVAQYVTAAQWNAQVKTNLDNPGFNLLGQNSPRPNRMGQIGEIFYRYDERGNVAGRQGQDGVRSFAWNALNQMTASQFKPAGSDEVNLAGVYYHDAFGRRIAKIVIDMRNLRYDSAGEPVPGTLVQSMTRYVWDGDRLLQEITEGQVKTIVYEPNGFVPLAQVVQERDPNQPALTWEEQQSLTLLLSGSGLSGEVKQTLLSQIKSSQSAPMIHLFLTDHLGTPYRMVDANTHETVWERVQGPWGETLSETVSDQLPLACMPTLRFQGQQYDWETGFHYNRHRHYDWATHRYLAQDPIGLAGGRNFYAYGKGNPTRFVDPRGLDPIKAPSIPSGTKTSMPENSVFRCSAKLGDPSEKPGTYDAAHAYTCIVVNGVLQCKGLVPENYGFGGSLFDEAYNPEICNKTDENAAYAKCVEKTWENGGTSYLLTGTCQGYDYRLHSWCKKIASLYKPAPAKP